MATDITVKKGTAFLLSNGMLKDNAAKTSHGLIRGSERFEIKCVIDHIHAGQDAGMVLDGKFRNIPVTSSLEEAVQLFGKPDYCIIGIATVGGILPDEITEIIKEALSLGISVVNGLHRYLSDIPGMKSLAVSHNAQILDIRKPKPTMDLHFWSAEVLTLPCPVIAVLGMDCAIGKRTAAGMITEACTAGGLKAEMIYTGQTGWLQGIKYGFILDSTLNDFVSGELSHAILSAYQYEHPDIILLEGQSSLRNPSGPCGSEFLLSGNAKKTILVHRIKQEYYNNDASWGTLPSVEDEIKLIAAYGSEVIALMLNTSGCDLDEALSSRERFSKDLGIPVFLPVENGVADIVPVIRKLLPKASYV